MKTISLLLISAFLFFGFAADWISITSKDDGYKIAFPSQPEKEKQNVPSEVGELTMNMLIYDASEKEDENLVYLFNSTVYPDSLFINGGESLAKGILDGATKGAAKNVKGNILSEKTITINGHDGRECKIDFQDGAAIIVMHAYLVKNKMYVLEVITYTKNADNKSMKKFFDSFELL